MGEWLVDNLIEGILNWFAGLIVGAIDVLWNLLASTVFQSPDVTKLPQVTSFASTSQNIVNGCYVLAFLWMAIMVMGRDTIQSRVGPGELIPRLIIGLIASNFAIPLCSTMIDLANALTTALTSQSITSPGSMQQLRATVTAALTNQAGTSPESFLLLLIGLIIAVLVVILLVQYIIRLGILIVAVGIAPIALALHGTPQTEGAAKLWWRTVAGTLGTVVIQAVALHTTLRIFLDPGANLLVLGLPNDAGATMNLLVVVCMLFGVVKIPGMMRRYVTQTKPSSAGMILRVILVQQLTQSLRKGLSAARIPSGRGPSGPGPARSAPAPTWPVRPTGGATRPTAPSTGPSSSSGPSRPLPRPAGAGPGRVGVAYPTARPVRPYTRDELAQGVDVYTRAMKSPRGTGAPPSRTTP